MEDISNEVYDSLKIDYDEETGQITIDWDKDDPKWSFLNNIPQEEIQQILVNNLQNVMDNDKTYEES